MKAYSNLRAIVSGDIQTTGVFVAELADLLAEVEQLRAAAPKKARAKKAAPAVLATLPDWMPLEAWGAFLAMRVKIKKPATEYAQQQLVRKLEAFYAADMDPAQILNQSIMNCWQDVYAPKTEATSRGFPRLTVGDQNAANNAEALRLLGQPMFSDDGMTIEAMP